MLKCLMNSEIAIGESFFKKLTKFHDCLKLYLGTRVFVFAVLTILSVTPLFAQNYQSGYPNSFRGKRAFQQEIARLEITVERKGNTPLPISLVPRVEKGDLLRVKMLDEPINGIRPEESFWDWTLVVGFVNPSRNEVEQESVSREIRFKRDGWYREHLFKVPYDSQPVFFLYPKGKYRKKIKKLLKKNFSQIKKIGEKTLEIAGAYAQIGIFLNELQRTINQNPYGFGGGYNNYGTGRVFREGFVRDQFVERLAQTFNIALPSCWTNGGGYTQANDFVGRAQCVAKNVRLEDFDLSVGRMLQQGGLLAATKLVEKYPQLAYWINVAAAAADLILKILQKTPLKIVPTLAQARINIQNNNNQYNYGNDQNRSVMPIQEKISLFAEKPPTDSDYVTAFPIVLHKWQAEPDPEVISLPVPSLLEPCLHMGQNILKNTDLSYDWLRDPFARDYKLIMSAENGFSREFWLTKNRGMSGWMLMLNPQDTQAFPKVKMNLEAQIVATRGFSHIESKKFSIPISGGGKWEIPIESLAKFSVGGKRRVVIKNTQGSCRCLQSVKYRPSFGGEFTFIANSAANPLQFNSSGTEAWFDIDTTHFQPGQGTIELRAYGNQQPQTEQVKLFAKPPEITKLYAHRGDNKVAIEGERIEQIKMLNIDGKTAQFVPDPNGQHNPSGSAKKVFIFQNPSNKILTNRVAIEMVLEAARLHKAPRRFPVLPARPNIKANDKKEIEAIVFPDENPTGFDLSAYPVVPVDTNKMTVAVKSTLADYSFKRENISIETRIENGQVEQQALPQATFEVLDTFNLRIGFQFSKQNQQFLAGRRLQFRIKDRQRGDSNWYSIKQTFVRIPRIDSIICRGQECKITGTGLDYIGKVSTDGGNVWQPPLQVQPTPDRKSFMSILGVKDKKLLRIKLRDFANTEGLPIGK